MGMISFKQAKENAKKYLEEQAKKQKPLQPKKTVAKPVKKNPDPKEEK